MMLDEVALISGFRDPATNCHVASPSLRSRQSGIKCPSILGSGDGKHGVKAATFGGVGNDAHVKRRRRISDGLWAFMNGHSIFFGCLPAEYSVCSRHRRERILISELAEIIKKAVCNRAMPLDPLSISIDTLPSLRRWRASVENDLR